jgi:cytochrome d ubiquinol oxidase subunit I
MGDLHGLNTLEHQPQKIAAMEGIWETERGAALRLFAIPDQEERTNHYEITIPKLTSLILTHEWDGEVKGLNEFEHHPPVAPVFFAFRIMIGVGVLMLIVSWTGAWVMRRKGEPTRWLAVAFVGMAFSGWVATTAGWYTTEIGRQPWLVDGVLMTADAVSDVSAGMVATTLVAYLIVYVVLIVAFISTVFYLARKAKEARTDRAPVGTRPGVASSRQVLEEGGL